MLINKIYTPNKININKKNNNTTTARKTPSFSGKNVAPSNTNNPASNELIKLLGQYFTNKGQKSITEIHRDSLAEKIDKSSLLNKHENVKEIVEKMVFYAKNQEQLKLINQILTNEELLNQEFITKIQYAIQAASNPAKQQLVSKVLSNKVLYNNANLIQKLEQILYADELENIVLAKISVIDKILNSEILSQNEIFMENIAEIISQIDSKLSADITNDVFECILKNEKYSQSEQFIGAIGKVFATQEFHRRYNNALDEVKKEFGNNSSYANIISAISFILDSATLNTFKKLMENETFAEEDNLTAYFPRIVSCTLSKNTNKIDDVIKYIKKNIYTQTRDKNEKIIQEYMYYDFESLKEVEQFIDVQNEALNKKYQLKEAIKNLSDSDVIDFFDYNKPAIRAAIKLLGQNTFVHSFPTKLSGVNDLAEKCLLIQNNLDEIDYEELLLKLNPSESKKYKELINEIKFLKKQYPSVKANGNSAELINLQKQINTKTKQAQEIIKNRINLDPDTKINRIKVIAGLTNHIKEKNAEKKEKPEDHISFFITLLRNASNENEFIWNRAVSEKIFEKFGMKYDENVANKIDLVSSKYINEIFSADLRFSNSLKDIFNLIKNNPEKSITDIFNDLPSNKKTKELFQRFGINYEKWINYDENSKVTVSFDTSERNIIEIGSNLLQNIFNDSFFKNLPEKIKGDLENKLKSEGINIRRLKYLYDDNDFKYILSINDIATLKKTIKIIQNELNNDCWSAKFPDININLEKDVIYRELTKVISKIRELTETTSDTTSTITIKKVNMNNISKSLFLGNDASCCTSVGRGAKQWSAATYVKNKMFGAIEILDGKTPIGNTMCYLTIIDDKVSLVLDNIELKPKYRNDNNIRDGIIQYAKQLCEEIEAPNIPVYIGSHRNKVDLNNYFPELKDFKIIGNTGDDSVYLDFLNSGDKINFDSNVYTNAIMTRVV